MFLRVEGAMSSYLLYFKKLKLFPASIDSENNGPRLFCRLLLRMSVIIINVAIACVQPPPPLRKNREKGREEGGCTQASLPLFPLISL